MGNELENWTPQVNSNPRGYLILLFLLDHVRLLIRERLFWTALNIFAACSPAETLSLAGYATIANEIFQFSVNNNSNVLKGRDMLKS